VKVCWKSLVCDSLEHGLRYSYERLRDGSRVNLAAAVAALDQKMIFPANCTLKGSPGPMPGVLLLLRVEVLRPKVDDDSVPTLGLARFVRLKRLNISARSCRLIPSWIVVFLTSAASTVAKPGPRTEFRCMVPKVPNGAGANVVLVNHCTYGEAPDAVGVNNFLSRPAAGFPIRLGRS
jgi:hypothetical protein